VNNKQLKAVNVVAHKMIRNIYIFMLINNCGKKMVNMYSIKYYKTERDKPKIKEPKNYNYIETKRFLYQCDLIERCWNIKSLTIDLDDIKHVIYDDKCHNLFGLYARIGQINTSEIHSITILNNNLTNLLYIYEIINCDWMINKNMEQNEDEEEAAKTLRLGVHFKRIK
jgi:hypothetical protein